MLCFDTDSDKVAKLVALPVMTQHTETFDQQ